MPVLVGPAPTYVSKNFREGRVGTFFSADSAEIQRTPHLHGLSSQLQQLQPFCRRLGVAMQAPIIAKGSEDLFAEVGGHPCGCDGDLQPTVSDFGGQKAEPEGYQTKMAGWSSPGPHYRL